MVLVKKEVVLLVIQCVSFVKLDTMVTMRFISICQWITLTAIFVNGECLWGLISLISLFMLGGCFSNSLSRPTFVAYTCKHNLGLHLLLVRASIKALHSLLQQNLFVPCSRIYSCRLHPGQYAYFHNYDDLEVNLYFIVM